MGVTLFDFHTSRVAKQPIKIRNEMSCRFLSCAKEVEALPGIFGHPADLCHKLRYSGIVTCADG